MVSFLIQRFDRKYCMELRHFRIRRQESREWHGIDSFLPQLDPARRDTKKMDVFIGDAVALPTAPVPNSRRSVANKKRRRQCATTRRKKVRFNNEPSEVKEPPRQRRGNTASLASSGATEGHCTSSDGAGGGRGVREREAEKMRIGAASRRGARRERAAAGAARRAAGVARRVRRHPHP